MKTVFVTLLLIAATVLAVDFFSGLIHWLEDAYIRKNTPLIGKYIAPPNIVHHHYPRYMTRLTWWQSSRDLVLTSAIIVIVAWCFGWLTWPVWLFAALSANGNEFHKWEHRSPKENGRLITFLQRIKLLQTAKHHALHHTDPKNSHYCAVTNFLNPFLDGIHFWGGLEWLLARTLGLSRREDTSIRGHGPGPAWLSEFDPKNLRQTAASVQL